MSSNDTFHNILLSTHHFLVDFNLAMAYSFVASSQSICLPHIFQKVKINIKECPSCQSGAYRFQLSYVFLPYLQTI